MAEEQQVGEAVLEFLGRLGVPGSPEVLVARWVADSLPAEPVNGASGVRQLLHALDMLQELLVEAGSVHELDRLHSDGYVWDTESDQRNLTERVRTSPEATATWLAGLRQAVQLLEGVVDERRN
jgi:hypothetical protein